jgi:hypothetical protein
MICVCVCGRERNVHKLLTDLTRVVVGRLIANNFTILVVDMGTPAPEGDVDFV